METRELDDDDDFGLRMYPGGTGRICFIPAPLSDADQLMHEELQQPRPWDASEFASRDRGMGCCMLANVSMC